ncbi:ABC-F family ATP-binding cassette domain-containing protein [Novosphingobium sediminicola]|uniref:ATPase subunit of ABC transporter with duplicated ATPase domains n=1 Tax=Novosphingobium sediminicola TaxID=563162 RepID=A0A7W6G832_9SPHN|nr:ATP-binding cassette domain-containing protein [Novosphingobium sediminicola]MBB3955572.1 ATPase subunit of ABC transporter with duplicated ATPase domains [Novosphingobium sediminicola]
MPAFLTLDGVSIATPAGRVLFSDLSFSLNRECIGLVGRNGSGKSSLLRAIIGEIAPLSGHITRMGTIGMVRQNPASESLTTGEALGIADALARMERIEAGKGSEADFAEADWTLPARLDEALAKSGLGPVDHARALSTFSGGERTRLSIARLWLDGPDLLLLDEPTNNLDADGREAMAGLLADWRGGALIASHDRALLEHVDGILALSPTGTTWHGGGWSCYVEARDAAQARMEADVEQAEREKGAAARQAQQARERQARRDRRGEAYAASGSAPKILLGRQRERAQNTGGRGRMLSDQQVVEASALLANAKARLDIAIPLKIELPSSLLPAHRQLLSFDHVSWHAAGRKVVDDLSFTLQGPERVALTGRNGAGKSTVFKLACGQLAPHSGEIRRPDEPLAILDQHVDILHHGATILDNMRRLNKALTENEARAALARFAFRNVEADRVVAGLSGGECLRAGLACILSARSMPPLLLLDEPTNHLDLPSIEVMERALRAYDGAIFVISHDRAFLNAIGITREITLPPPSG